VANNLLKNAEAVNTENLAFSSQHYYSS